MKTKIYTYVLGTTIFWFIGCIAKKDDQLTGKSIKIGDTVMVDVVMHNGSVGVVRDSYDRDFYVDYFNCNCNGWYPAFEVHPFSNSWNININQKK